jgi:hydrogenase maturation protein HypF
MKTTMAEFAMCSICRNEYENIQDRRFHAQPVACNFCGPVYSLHSGGKVITDFNPILEELHWMITTGKIIAIKGTGGFHLMCNALNASAVSRLRTSKRREGKPFAVMFKDIHSLKEYAIVSEVEEKALNSWRKPIVVLKATRSLARGVSMELDTLGAFLPYMPLHHLLLSHPDLKAIVLTSGNLAEEPIIIDNKEACSVLSGVADAVVTYNREIYNRTDDSVVRVIAGRERVQRRSRGYVPAPLKLDFSGDGILPQVPNFPRVLSWQSNRLT